MRNAFILCFVFALAAAGTNAQSASDVQLAGAGTNAQSVSGVQLYRPHSEHPTLCRRGYNMEDMDVETIQALVAYFYKNQTYLTNFGCRLVNRMFCELAEGEFRMSPKQECFNPRGGNNPIAPILHPLMFNGASIGGDSSAIQKATKKMPNMNDFHVYQTPTIIYVGDKKVRVFEAVSAILFECVEVRSLVYVHNKDAPMPERAERAVMLEVHEEGMCMSPKAVNTIVKETMTTGDAPLDLYFNKHTYDGCFRPHIEKYLRSKEITHFVNMSKSGNSNRTRVIELWVKALNEFSKISDDYTDSTVYDEFKAIMEKAAIESGVCVDPKMDTKEMDRLKWLIESDPNTWGEGFFEILTFFLCDSEGIDVNRFDDPVSIIEKIFRVLAESQTNWVKIKFECKNFSVGVKSTWNLVVKCVKYVWKYVQNSVLYVAEKMHACFSYLFNYVCGNLNKVGLVLAIAGVIVWSVRKWLRDGRMSWPTLKQKQRNMVRKRQSSSFKQQLLKHAWQKFADCCSCLKPKNATKPKANSGNWDPLKQR
jgi:hypothetical protein